MPEQVQVKHNHQTIFLTILAIRLLNALTISTFFQPDEYYQALEPAWNFTRSSSGAWITWEWNQHLRSAIHPVLFSTVYYLANLVLHWFPNPDLQDSVLVVAPKILQAVVAALGDYYTWKLSDKVYGHAGLARATLCLGILNPWQWFCSTRTFSNGLESTLTVAALFYWPFDGKLKHDFTMQTRTESGRKDVRPSHEQEIKTTAASLRTALVLGATASIMRPTNILIWITLACYALSESDLGQRNDNSTRKDVEDKKEGFVSRFSLLAREGVLCGALVLALSTVVDRAFYGVWTFPALNFLYFNVVQSLAVFYGNNDWHYYLSQGYPLLLTATLPFTVVGMFSILYRSFSFRTLSPFTQRSLTQLATVCLVLPAALSVLSHKEVRFIYPVLGPLLVVSSLSISDFFGPLFLPKAKATFAQSVKIKRGLILVLLFSLNIIIAGYTSLIYNSGIIALPDYLRSEFTSHHTTIRHPHSTSQNMTVAFLMPCHSVPWRSHLLHPPTQSEPGIQAWALTCEPPLHLTSPSEKKTYLDEADIFYANPNLWLRKHMSRQPPWTFSGLKDHPQSHRHRDQGIHVAPGAKDNRNKILWTSASPPDTSSSTQGLDITDLLPHLQTAPGKPPASESEDHIPTRRPWPHYLAFFEQLEPTLTSTLRGSGYVECWRRFNSHFHDDFRRTGDVVVWCLFPDRASTGRYGALGGFRSTHDKRHMRVDGVIEKQKQQQQRKDKIIPERSGTQTVVRPGS